MRIIGGSRRGTRIAAPAGDMTRPTPDMVREALFNIITGIVQDAYVLDLFAGSGAIGFEALSRGADRVVFVDKAAGSVKVIRQNAETLRFTGQSRVYHASAEKALNELAARGESFDIIYLDPPYGNGVIQRFLPLIKETCVLKDRGVIVAESGGPDLKNPGLEGLAASAGYSVYDTRRYGGTVLDFMTATSQETTH